MKKLVPENTRVKTILDSIKTQLESSITTTEDTDVTAMESLLGQRVILLCANYFYTGKLVGINETCVELEEPAIVYETGQWSAAKYTDEQKLKYTDEQKLQMRSLFVSIPAIESFGLSK